MQKWQDHADVAKVKEAYSILSNAVKMAIAENGQIVDWAWPEPTTNYSTANANFFAEELAKYLKVQKYCGSVKGCFMYGYKADGSKITFDNGWYKGVSGAVLTGTATIEGSTGKMILSNGMRIQCAFYLPPTHPNNFESASYILVDTNGESGPNRWGYDVFRFAITADGIGLIDKGRTVVQNCNPIINTPQRRVDDGASCVYWVIKHDNMDYKYRDISAEW